MYPQCVVCQINVRYRDLEKARNMNNNEKIAVMSNVIGIVKDFIDECSKETAYPCVPTILATKLFRFMKKVLGSDDPYLDEKIASHKEALKLYDSVKKIVFSEADVGKQLERAIRFSILGNLLDIGVLNYTPPKVEEIIEKALKMDIYGDLIKAIDILLNSKNVVVILDNAGEAVFDKLLADVLRENGAKVYAIVKGRSFQNDVTIKDAFVAELDKSFDVVLDTGTDASSIFLDELREEARKAIEEANVIVAKGMANYEYITEVERVLGKTVIYLLVAKCMPISIDTGIPLGKAGVLVHRARRVDSM
ncbi:MAG: ARMT1-like domain-containing protein [Ignisphaera sp.]